MDPELGGDGPYPPVLDEVVAQDLRLELVVDRHRARRSVPGATPSASSYRRATPLPTDELADRARAEVAVHLGSAARCASSLGGRFGRHRRIGLAHRNSMRGEFSIARGASGTVMRHFVRARAFAAPAPVAPLALGMTVAAAPRVLIPASRPAQRFTPSEAAAARPAVVLARSQRKQMSTWRRHRAQRNSRASSIAPPGGEGWTIRDHRAILHSEPYASADLGAASDVTAKSVQSEAASASSPTPISHQLTSDVIAGTRGVRLLWQAASAQGENHDTSQAGAVGRFSAGSLRPAQSVHEGCSPFIRAFSQPPTKHLWVTRRHMLRCVALGPSPLDGEPPVNESSRANRGFCGGTVLGIGSATCAVYLASRRLNPSESSRWPGSLRTDSGGATRFGRCTFRARAAAARHRPTERRRPLPGVQVGDHCEPDAGGLHLGAHHDPRRERRSPGPRCRVARVTVFSQ